MTTSSWWYLARGRGARWGVVVLWVLGAVLSYSALRRLALMVGFPDLLADLWPLVIDVAVWVGAMNALEAAAEQRRIIARYAWVLVGLFSTATVAGNALVAGTEPVDPRMVHALGNSWAHCVSQLAHAAPAVTMILFAHLAGLLVGRRPQLDETAELRRDLARLQGELDEGRHTLASAGPTKPASPAVGKHDVDQRPAAWSWPSADHPHGHDSRHGAAVSAVAPPPAAGLAPGHPRGTALTATEAKRATVRLVRRARAAGKEVSTGDVQRTTGRSARQARRLLALAVMERVADVPHTASTVGEVDKALAWKASDLPLDQ
jgi:hypothetical protein